ncbi:protein FAM151B isoform X2 [Syngnathoides biaculeatus]|uniref:protein FAM151B isoform X2 n=1 Tax=Syngnathoides biaculeatus TaxID=300417 RepID=UPI002ADE953C|nr:protein FAM151B isoform X2 [Syngnathoides biaculeatus]
MRPGHFPVMVCLHTQNSLVSNACAFITRSLFSTGELSDSHTGTDRSEPFRRGCGDMCEQVVKYFQRQIKTKDGAEVTWSHAVNTRSKLVEALQGPNLMIEADIIVRGHDPKEPVMGHPPDTDSDITLKEWLEGVKMYGKGIKLDFKSMEALSLSVGLLQEVQAQFTSPVWINADILRGPGSQVSPLEPQVFLAAVRTLPTNVVLSLGWTTKWDAGTDNSGYSWEMVHEMEDICRGLQHLVTFPVRGALLAQSVSELTWLLQQSDRSGCALPPAC